MRTCRMPHVEGSPDLKMLNSEATAQAHLIVVLALPGGGDGEVEARQKELWTMTEWCEECRTAASA